MNRFSLLTTMLAIVAAAPGPSSAQPASATQPVSHEALFLMERVGSPAVSRDGKWVVFPVTVPAYDEKNETADLWIVPVVLPQGFDPGRKYPLLVLIHGGHASVNCSP